MWGEDYTEKEILDLERKYTIRSYAASRTDKPLIIEKAEGIYLWDYNGKQYLDFSAHYWCCQIGYNNSEMIDAIKDQLTLTSISAMFIHRSRVQLAELLTKVSPGNLGKCHFEITGADAIEASLKFARKYTKKYKVISLWEGYTGQSTLGALSAHGITYPRLDFEPLLPGFFRVSPPYCYRCDFGLQYPDCGLACLEILEKTIIREGNVAAVLVEPIIHGGGVIAPPIDYIQGLREVCNRRDVLLIFDEIVTGFGRTGKMFGCEHYTTIPDMLVIGKGLTSGYIAGSGVIVPDDVQIFDSFKIYEPAQVHSLSASPLSCVAAIKNIEIILKDKLIENAKVMGKYFIEGLNSLKEKSNIIGDVRGKGLMVGVEIVKDKQTKEPDKVKETSIIDKCREKGLIVEGCEGVQSEIVPHPPLIVKKEQIDEALNILHDAIREIE